MPRPPLSTEQILARADHHHRCTGEWPTSTSGRVLDARGDNWQSVDRALRDGMRGLAGGSSLARLLEAERAVPNRLNRPRLTRQRILAWAVAHHQRTGSWPNMDSGPVVDASGETWSGVNAALREGCRGLPGGITLAQLLAERLGARNHTNIPPLTVAQILAWADAHHRRTGRWPRHTSGPVLDAPGETWAAVESALQQGYRSLEGGTSLYRLLRKHRQIPGHRPAVRRRKLSAAGRGRRRIRIHFPDEVLARYRAGELDTGEVAELCGVSYEVAARELRRAGVEIRSRGRPRGTRPAQHADIIRRYRRGESLQQVAQELGLSRGRVATVLKRYGVARRAPGPDLWKEGMSPADRKRLAEHLTGLRRAAGLTQDELSARSGLTQVTLSALENGRQCPTRSTMDRLAKGLGVQLPALEPEDDR